MLVDKKPTIDIYIFTVIFWYFSAIKKELSDWRILCGIWNVFSGVTVVEAVIEKSHVPEAERESGV